MFYPNGSYWPTSVTEAVMRLSRVLRRRPPFVPVMPRVSHRAMWLLHAVLNNEGISSSELSELLDIRPSSLTDMLNRLEEDGFIIREKDTQDLRVTRISLSEEGMRFLEDASAPWRAYDDFSDILTDEETANFLKLCNKLSDGLEKRYSSESQVRYGPMKNWGFVPKIKGYRASGGYERSGWPYKEPFGCKGKEEGVED